MERDVSHDVAYDRTHADAVSCSEQILPVLPPRPVTITSIEPQCGGGLNQTSGVPLHSSQISNEGSSGTSGVPDAPSALHSGQGSSIPNLPMPLTTPQESGEEPEGTHNEDTNQASDEIFLEVVVPETGPMTGGIRVVLLGKNFPSTPLHVRFGDNWARAVSCKLYCSSSWIDPQTYDRNGTKPVLCYAAFLHLLRRVVWT